MQIMVGLDKTVMTRQLKQVGCSQWLRFNHFHAYAGRFKGQLFCGKYRDFPRQCLSGSQPTVMPSTDPKSHHRKDAIIPPKEIVKIILFWTLTDSLQRSSYFSQQGFRLSRFNMCYITVRPVKLYNAHRHTAVQLLLQVLYIQYFDTIRILWATRQ